MKFTGNFSVILPAFKEEENIPAVVEEERQVAERVATDYGIIALRTNLWRETGSFRKMRRARG